MPLVRLISFFPSSSGFALAHGLCLSPLRLVPSLLQAGGWFLVCPDKPTYWVLGADCRERHTGSATGPCCSGLEKLGWSLEVLTVLSHALCSPRRGIGLPTTGDRPGLVSPRLTSACLGSSALCTPLRVFPEVALFVLMESSPSPPPDASPLGLSWGWEELSGDSEAGGLVPPTFPVNSADSRCVQGLGPSPLSLFPQMSVTAGASAVLST